MNNIDPNTTLEQLLIAAPERRRIFENLGIDFQRDRDHSLAEVCAAHVLETKTVARMLAAFAGAMTQVPPVSLDLMTLTGLCDHLEHSLHSHLWDELARLDRLTGTAAEKHGAQNPQLRRIRSAFVAFREQITAHLREEADTLFPLIRQIEAGTSEQGPVPSPLQASLARMKSEHNLVDESLAELRTLADDERLRRTVPAEAKTMFDAITSLERALHELIYQENQNLFSRIATVAGAA